MGTTNCMLSDLQPGMVLAQPILDDKGRTIMQEGARLTPMAIRRLEKWGIEAVRVASGEDANPPSSRRASGQTALQEASPEDRDRMRSVAAAVQERFQNVADDPIMDDLKRLAVRHLVLHAQESVPGIE